MDDIGMDVHKLASQLCVIGDGGEVYERRVRTDRGCLTGELGERPRSRILIEASTESEWVARHLESIGHEVIVGDPSFAPMYGTRSRRVKTDRRDARALAEALRLGAYRPVHRVSEEQRRVRAELAVRDGLVRARTRWISLVRSLLRSEGYRVPSGSSSGFVGRVAEMELPGRTRSTIAPVLAVMLPLNRQVDWCDRVVTRIVAKDPVVRRLTTVPGVGPITSAGFVATIDDVKRFRGADKVAAYVGVVPSEVSSGEKHIRGPITKSGHKRIRSLLVEAAWCVLRQRSSRSAALREWAERIAARRGKNKAAVALARKLARILFALWRDGTSYEVRADSNKITEPAHRVTI
ncbi:MAG: IS110 family transposase [Planctomycetota bacterium]